jgi:hypothetical protein
MPDSTRSSETVWHSREFLARDLDELTKGIKERLAAPIPGFGSRAQQRCGFPGDKWLLSSAVQKLIRRGRVEQAVKIALALHKLDPTYLPRRLPIIAFEDIGIGNLEVCFDTLHVFSTQRFAADIPELDRRHLIANLVDRLARSVKSRVGCDIFCLAHVDQNISTAAAKFSRSSEQCLIAMASDRDAEVTSRALALHLLSGMSVQEGRWHRTLSRFNPGALRAIAKKLHLPPAVAWMLIEGRNTAGLAAMLPLVVEAVADATDLQTKQIDEGEPKALAEKPILGLPACSADMYTRVGKAAIADFTRAIKQKCPRLFENIRDARTYSKLMGMVIFHFEGSKLDRWLENSALADYRERVEQAELQTLGVLDPALRQRLYRLLELEHRLLWQIRRSHLRKAFGDSRRAT